MAVMMCGVRWCVRPDHIKDTDSMSLVKRITYKARPKKMLKVCRFGGHPMTPENIVVRGKKKVRNCRICYNARQLAYRHRREMRQNET